MSRALSKPSAPSGASVERSTRVRLEVLGHLPAPSRPPALRAVLAVARREIRDHVASLHFLLITLLVLVLAPLATYVGVRDYQGRLSRHDKLVTERAEIVDSVEGMVHGLDLVHTPANDLAVMRVVRMPSKLSVLVRGLDGAIPSYWDFTPAGVMEGPPSSLVRSLTEGAGNLDLEFIVRVVLGLLAILLAFDAVAGEKESGALKAVLSQPLSRNSFITGKLLGGAVMVAVPLVIAVLSAVTVAEMSGIDLLSGTDLAIVGIMTACGFVYLLSLFCASLMVSSLVRRQRTSLVLVLVSWVLVVLALPLMAALVARAAYPVPSSQVYADQRRLLNQDLQDQEEQGYGAIFREVTGEPIDRASREALISHKPELERLFAESQIKLSTRRRRLLGELAADRDRRVAVQGRLARALMSLSPGAVFSIAAAELCETGEGYWERWSEALRRHQSELDELVFKRPSSIFVRNGNATAFLTLKDPLMVSDLPGFAPPRRTVEAVLDRAIGSIMVLILFVLVFVIAGYIAFSRYDVR